MDWWINWPINHNKQKPTKSQDIEFSEIFVSSVWGTQTRATLRQEPCKSRQICREHPLSMHNFYCKCITRKCLTKKIKVKVISLFIYLENGERCSKHYCWHQIRSQVFAIEWFHCKCCRSWPSLTFSRSRILKCEYLENDESKRKILKNDFF